MITHDTKWFFLGSNESSYPSLVLYKVQYDVPFGEDVFIDCGQLGQILALDVATATLNEATVPDRDFDCACCTPIEA
jgi:hypothetical protein